MIDIRQEIYFVLFLISVIYLYFVSNAIVDFLE